MKKVLLESHFTHKVSEAQGCKWSGVHMVCKGCSWARPPSALPPEHALCSPRPSCPAAQEGGAGCCTERGRRILVALCPSQWTDRCVSQPLSNCGASVPPLLLITAVLPISLRPSWNYSWKWDSFSHWSLSACWMKARTLCSHLPAIFPPLKPSSVSAITSSTNCQIAECAF